MNPKTSEKIETAKIIWQTDDNGITVPVSTDFGDVYFSKTDGLAESRYVFIDGNNLAERLANLQPFERFVIGEIGFGTGLNVLAIWQLWQQIRPDNHSHLHIITTEKFPLSQVDLAKALSVWQELSEFSAKLIDNYPPPLTGCHRLNFFDERFTLDIWLGDATQSLSQIIGNAKVNAWLLDGFAPACNGELWADNLFAQIARLSAEGTTLATFSVANVVKMGLKNHGFTLAKRKGFGKKREMLTASFVDEQRQKNLFTLSLFKGQTFFLLNEKYLNKRLGKNFNRPPFAPTFFLKLKYPPKNPLSIKTKNSPNFALPILPKITQSQNIAIIGAGVAGLATAYMLAVRGHRVAIFDKDEPLAGASGNPRAVLAPKLTSLDRLPTNLHAIGYLASLRFYPALSQATGFDILHTTQALDLLAFNRVTSDEVSEFPSEFVEFLTAEKAQEKLGENIGETIFVPKAGLINTANFAKAILAHPHIEFVKGELKGFEQVGENIKLDYSSIPSLTKQCFSPTQREGNSLHLWGRAGVGECKLSAETLTYDHLILCMALDTCDFLPNIKRFNYSRGQVSWFSVDEQTYQKLPSQILKYGGYFAKFSENEASYVMLGASFVRDTQDLTVKDSEHQVNMDDFNNALPKIAKKIGNNLQIDKNWHGRARLRSQTVDYLPLIGQVWQPDKTTNSRVWTFSALGSKGYAYAPIGSELITGLICGEILPLAKTMVEKLSPNRRVIQK